MSDWTRPLTEPLRDKRKRKTLRTLADARAYALKLKPHVANDRHWQHAAKLLMQAAEDGEVEAVSLQLKLALLMDGVLDMGTK